jgi:hypothetical protein
MKTHLRSFLSPTSLLSLVPCALALLGCASESVDLGGGTIAQELRRGSRCVESPFVEGDVVAGSQAEVAALEGCQEVRGDLVITLFSDADLSPLHELRAVDGSLTIGLEASFAAFGDEDLDFDALTALAERDAELLANGWLTSLQGLEQLERVGALMLVGTSASDLSALQRLRSVGGTSTLYGPGVQASGTITLSGNRELLNLTGLESVRGVDALAIFNSPNLVSLSGVALDREVSAVTLSDAPALVDLSALSPLIQVTTLTLSGLGVTDLSALATLETADFLGIAGNPALVDASALENLVGNSQLSIYENGALRSLPSFARWVRVPDEIYIHDNPVLESIELEFGGVPNAYTVDDEPRVFPTRVVTIENNAQLRTVSVPAVDYQCELCRPSEGAGLLNVGLFLLRDNPSLSSVDFGGLRRAGLLSIANNQSLSSVTLGELARVEDLEVTNNPQLSADAFDGVATFERTLSGNLP